MFYTVYKVTNKINNKFYIGMHQTDCLNDGYMGSGKIIKKAIEKYGMDNFTKEILHIFDNENDMRNKEKELVVLNENSYNICDGGKGGFGYINRSGKGLRTGAKLSDETKKKISEAKKGIKLSENHKLKIMENHPMKNENNRKKISETLKGRKKSVEHRKKISDAIRNRWKQMRIE
jgi:group I intron endonuclease